MVTLYDLSPALGVGGVRSSVNPVPTLDDYHRHGGAYPVEAPDGPADDVLQLLHSLRLHPDDDVVDAVNHPGLLNLLDGL